MVVVKGKGRDRSTERGSVHDEERLLSHLTRKERDNKLDHK